MGRGALPAAGAVAAVAAVAVVFVSLVLAAGLFSEGAGAGGAGLATVETNLATLRCEVADSPEEWSRGLSERDSLPADGCMLFVFPSPAPRSFWMRGMRFPLDIVFLDGGRVVDVKRDFQPCTADPCPAYSPPSPADLVVEVNSGKAAEFGLLEGSGVVIGLPR